MILLPDAVLSVVEELGDAHIRSLVSAYHSAAYYSPSAAIAARHVLPAGHRDRADLLNTAWEASPETPGSAVALALETALAAKTSALSARIDVVITGPDSPATPVRLTSEVVRQLIGDARVRVSVISYAAYQIPVVIAALDAAVARGVRVDIILDHLYGGWGASAYAKYRVFHWPADQRDPADAKLHAKAVIVDNRDLLLTSANLTNAAYDKNIELGLLCQGGGLATRVQRHFDALVACGVLRAAS